MGTETKKAWWRQMGEVSRGLLFLDGHIASAAALAPADPAADPARLAARAARHERARQVVQARRIRAMTALSPFR